jgi:hypothetical protein
MLAMMTPGTVGNIANIVKGYALAIGVAFGMWIVWMWWQHARQMARTTAQAQAKAIYGRYLEQALGHPELAQPPAGSMTRGAQYEWFVGYLLNVADQILLVDPSPAWKATLGHHLTLHKDVLLLPAFRDGPYRQLSPALRELVDTVSRA